MQALQSRLENPAFQRGITEMGLSMLANSGPSAQPRSFGQILGQGAMQGMAAHRAAAEQQKAIQQEEERKAAAQEAAETIEDPGLRRLALADPNLAAQIIAKRQITPYQQAQLDQGTRRLDLSAEQAAADQALAERNFGLKEQGLDLQRSGQEQRLALQRAGMDQDAAQHAASLALQRDRLAAANQPKEPADVQTLRAMGIDPQSAEGRQILQNSLTGAAEGQNATQFGSVPSGMARVADPTAEAGFRLVPLEGSKEQYERALQEEKRQNTKIADEQSLGTVTRDINRVLDMSREGVGGPLAGQVGQIPGIGSLTESGQMSKHLESIKANIAFGELQEMRNNSPTGGAVGSLTDKEREALSSVVGSLDPTLKEEDLQRNLVDYGTKRITAVHGTDEQIDAAVKTGRLSPEQARKGRELRDRQIAELRGETPEPPKFDAARINDLEARGEALEQQYIANGMDPREAEQLVASELRKEFGL